jgi:hypothetical protein
MLEFIVLGQIPGTGWQIGFTTILLVLVVAWLVIRVLRSYYRYHKFKSHLGQAAARYLLFMNKKPAKKRISAKVARKSSSKRTSSKSKKALHARQRLTKAHA